mgnify:CR=1 FL=1
MGIDWENILGDKVDLGDAYDSMAFGTSLNNDNSESERPYSLPTFDLDEWMEKYAKENNTYFCDQKKNFEFMKKSLEEFNKGKKELK